MSDHTAALAVDEDGRAAFLRHLAGLPLVNPEVLQGRHFELVHLLGGVSGHCASSI